LLNAEEQERRRTSDTNKIVSLGDLVLREKEGKRWARTKKHDITVFDSTGVAVQDVAIASLTLSLLKMKGTASKL
jgi:ornithine cyclodeaminase/alanine dehydrogenase-like protein (mu-crystallin family)